MAYQNARERVARLVAGQFGRVSWPQLKSLGISQSTVQAWLSAGYLFRILPGVYAVGHLARSTEADLISAVLYAGPGAMLSHATAAWWLGLADAKPHMIHVSTPRRCRSLPGIRVHQRRQIARVWHNNIPVTPLAQTVIDYAGRAPLSKVRLALARADYQGGLKVTAVEAELGRGRTGSSKVRVALQEHRPELARTKSGLEIVLFELCEAEQLPLPEINAEIAGWEVDALWRREHVAVEVDGWRNHRSAGQIRRDRRKDFALRAAHITVLRYADEQLEGQRRAVGAEIREALTPPARSA